MADEILYQDYIDRSSPIPLYQQVSADMVRRIAEEEWRVGDQLMSEITLAELYQVSRITMRQALSKLEGDGLIFRRQGGRSVVQARPQYLVQELQLPSTEKNMPSGASSGRFSIRAARWSEVVRLTIRILEEVICPAGLTMGMFFSVLGS